MYKKYNENIKNLYLVSNNYYITSKLVYKGCKFG